MSDHDRGAYTPQTDAPLSFDARQTRGRRAFPTTLVISLVILLGLGGAIFMFYRSGVRGAGEAPVPVGSPVGEIKAPAPAQSAQQSADAAAGLQIYKAEGAPAPAPSSAPVFTAGPEQPAPRPAPTTPVAVAVAPVVTHAVPATTPSAVAASGATMKAAPAAAAPAPAPAMAAAKSAPAPAPAKPVVVAAAKPAPAASSDAVADLLKSKAAPAPKPAAAKPVQLAEAKPAPQPVPATPPVTPAAHGAALVQIGAYSSAALAAKGWSDIAAAYPSDMAGKGKLVESIDRDGKTLWRGAVSGFTSHGDAVAFCSKLKTDGKACIVR